MALVSPRSEEAIGASLEGAFEAISGGSYVRRPGLHYVIAPSNRGEAVLSGAAAERSRSGLGLPWPPMARVGSQLPLERVPVPVLWRGLIHQRDGRPEWRADHFGTQFADLLAAHVAGALGGNGEMPPVILGVPDSLSTFSQQQLLNALVRSGIRKCQLLWNPVALALTWLESVGLDLAIKNNEDSLLVLNLGPGSIDCVAFRLREVTVEGKRWNVPVRRPGRIATKADGFDLVSQWLQDAALNAGVDLDLQALWYGLGLAEVWSGIPPSASDPSPLWYRGGRWERFPSALLEDTLNPEMGVSALSNVEQLLCHYGVPSRKHIESNHQEKKQLGLPGVPSDRNPKPLNWRDLLSSLISSAIQDRNIRGVVVAGLPFALKSPAWIDLIEDCLRTLKNPAIVPTPVVDGIWNAGDGGAAIANGAAEFGRRVQAGHPTYLDTLPQLDIYAATVSGGSWESLVRESEVAGGSVFRAVLQGEFALSEGQTELEAYLRLRDEDRESIRLTTFRFPRGPARQMPLEMRVQVRPAGGLAIVEMVPEEKSFLGGIQVYLDYDEMKEVAVPPKFKLGCPTVVEPHKVDPEDSILFGPSVSQAIDVFLASKFGSSRYMESLETLIKRMQIPNFKYDHETQQKAQFRIVDLYGKAATRRGQKMVEDLSAKIESDFLLANDGRSKNYSLRNKLITAGGWLFGAAPPSVRSFVSRSLHLQQSVHAAGRIFSEPLEVRLLFTALENNALLRKGEDRWITINWLWAAKRALSSHESAVSSLDRKQVVQLYEFLFHDIRSWIEKEQSNGFVATLWLLLYLLRYRVKEPDFLSNDSSKEQKLGKAFNQAIANAESGIRGRSSFLSAGRQQAAIEILNGIAEFRQYRGSMSIVTKLADLEEEE